MHRLVGRADGRVGAPMPALFRVIAMGVLCVSHFARDVRVGAGLRCTSEIQV